MDTSNIPHMEQPLGYQKIKYSGAIHFYYNTNLLGHFAKFELFFTPDSKRLHTVKIQWAGQKTKDTRLATEIISMISEKYGKPKKQGKRLSFKDTEWITEDANRIEMNRLALRWLVLWHSLQISLMDILASSEGHIWDIKENPQGTKKTNTDELMMQIFNGMNR